MAEPVPSASTPFYSGLGLQISTLREEVLRNMAPERVITGPAPTGYADLLVHQYNAPPGPKPEDPQKLPDWEERKKTYDKDYFVLPDSIKPINSIRELLQMVEKACFGGKRLRQLRIMGHGNVAQARFGNDVVYTSLIQYRTADGKQSPLVESLEELKHWLDPDVSLVTLDHCRTGLGDEFLIALSHLWGGVAVRAFTYYQAWEAGEIQVGYGPFRQCKGDTCRSGYEYHPDQPARDPGQQ